MKENKNRNYSYIKKIKEHANSALKTFNEIPIETFLEETIERKAILFDLFQVGELVSQMTKNLQLSLDKKEFKEVIAVRNYIVHGYDYLDNEIIIDCLKNQLAPFVDKLEINAYKIYTNAIIDLIGETITVLVDHPVDETHKVNEGHLRELSSPNYELQQVVIVDLTEPVFQIKAKVIGAIKMNNEQYYILLAALIDADYSESQIIDLINQKLHISDYELIMSKNQRKKIKNN